ncbi:hypothetical protein DICVIV_04802 [Dictyocaulus viviparus]|uniref:Uncharacterized protein n=1 Tax=Dictyocaulus viviparus TaxID=29172 RepID=A0A0D8XX56_DICVI|nr:hypothetical protein DICVIV_04802 [Dictyocaulus viviparus]
MKKNYFNRSMKFGWSSRFFFALLLPVLGYEKKATKPKASVWLPLMTLIPTIINLISLILILAIIQHVRKTVGMVNMVCTSSHLLARCAARLSVSPAAKKLILEYAQTRSEFARLLNEDRKI